MDIQLADDEAHFAVVQQSLVEFHSAAVAELNEELVKVVIHRRSFEQFTECRKDLRDIRWLSHVGLRCSFYGD